MEQQDQAEAAARPAAPAAGPAEPAWQWPQPAERPPRNSMHKKVADATRHHARWAGTEDGEVSSDGQSSVMSKVARKVGRMGWGSSAAHGNERGPDDLC